MLKYIVYVVSRKSFNPLAISDKKAHRLNGNINYSEAAKLLEENTHSFALAEITSVITVYTMLVNFPVQLIVFWNCVMVFFIIILSFIVLHEMGFLTLSMSHVIKEKTLVLLKLCEILCGYMRTFLMCWQGEFV